MKYDDVSWHNLDNKVTWEQAAAHIALFLRWCDQRGLTSEFLREDAQGLLDKARSGEITYTEFLFSHCDGKFTDQQLSLEGNRFSEAYYADGFLPDYNALCSFPSYSRTETEHDYPAICAVLDRRFQEFQASALSLPKRKTPKWVFWKKA